MAEVEERVQDVSEDPLLFCIGISQKTLKRSEAGVHIWILLRGELMIRAMDARAEVGPVPSPDVMRRARHHRPMPQSPQRPWTVLKSPSGQTDALHSVATTDSLPPTPIGHLNRHRFPINTMDDLREQVELLEKSANLSASIDHVQKAIDMLTAARAKIAAASTFVQEASRQPPRPEPTPNTPNPHIRESWERDLAEGTFNSEELQQKFAEMYHILHELRVQRNLQPAIQWARQRSAELEGRGSNLEFELCRLQYICLFDSHNQHSDAMDTEIPNGPLDAWAYAHREFPPFYKRYAREIRQFLGATAFWPNIQDSPYRRLFYNESAWEEVAHSFNREFCSLLGLSADSPLFIAATAGAIALPYLLKMQSIMKEKRTEWTTQDELPVEIPLPSQYHFHSIFVCPVSKEQSTDTNPPMMMPCGHVIAQESLDKLSKGSRFKCPYCPNESHPREARKVVL
ncbi:hypothetical protein GGP41_008467 [Bipolaris sorokiniana]|uniref:GID complex catalytic subunit 2 n=1 Tax=Cochliobolus sativus TaxID=45130 RepID=A0A8H5ZDR3_COCSA|nr:hypothetical protein GGP41_008467 [Bipolaris sorokiniana]